MRVFVEGQKNCENHSKTVLKAPFEVNKPKLSSFEETTTTMFLAFHNLFSFKHKKSIFAFCSPLQ